MGNLCFGPRAVPTEPIAVSELRTGDVICIRDPQCLHAGACLSQNLLCWESNHVGMALNPEDFSEGAACKIRAKHPEFVAGKVFVLHTLVTGVKVWDVASYAKKNKGKGFSRGIIWIRQLEVEGGDSDAQEEMRAQIAASTDELWGDVAEKPYEQKPCSMLSAYFDSCEGINVPGCCASNGDATSLFCSELVAMALQKGKVLGEERPPDEFVPMDFLASDGHTVEKASMATGMRLGPLRVLKPDPFQESASMASSQQSQQSDPSREQSHATSDV